MTAAAATTMTETSIMCSHGFIVSFLVSGLWWKVFSGSLVASPAVAIQLLRVTVSLPTLGKSWDLYSVALPFDFRIAKVK